MSAPVINVYAGDPPDPGQTAHYERSDLGNARRLVDSHGNDLRFVPEWSKWLAWDGQRWAEDITGEAQRRAKTIGEDILGEARDSLEPTKVFAFGIKSQSAAAINNMLTLASTEPGIPVMLEDLDADPMLFNAGNGTLDLRTGDLRPHRRRDLLTKVSTVRYEPNASCPTWDAFLKAIFPVGEELIGFVRRFAGYSLTGDVSEQVLAFFHGSGANGKTTLINALRSTVGDYGMQMDSTVITATSHDQHPTGVADLRGTRLVATVETEQGRRINESLIKQLTGSDAIRARRMHRDFFEFRPSHKLLIAGNHLPRIDGTDNGIWRRIALVPFTASFEAEAADRHLAAKLEAEATGILAWMVRGCLEWQKDGLQIPERVTAATTEYRTTQDHVGRFIADVCVVGNDYASVSAKALRAGYEAWCAEQGERPWSAQAVGRELTTRGYDRTKGGRAGHAWIGLDLLEGSGS